MRMRLSQQQWKDWCCNMRCAAWVVINLCQSASEAYKLLGLDFLAPVQRVYLRAGQTNEQVAPSESSPFCGFLFGWLILALSTFFPVEVF